MIWAFAVAAVAILYLAVRFRRFQSWVEPALTVIVAIGLVAAIVIWLADERRNIVQTSAEALPRPALAASEITVDGLEFIAGRPATSYRVTGTITNDGGVALQSFRLTVDLSDCPDDACRTVGSDSALIIARVPPGEAKPFTTFVVFPDSDLTPVTAPRWTWTIGDIRAYDR
ncbi:hypothetical protein LXM94_22760 [Rhizobium sp. TRM95111]|uniref:hypothetical protein n=1 Tax=Rhizobium alarense TaxID=2846851 RepID=UPI001F332010|nr:hypothetical protein [Rhizobium alarense]MCF3642792.1 hypothetical protein [Rhizobium alarense]